MDFQELYPSACSSAIRITLSRSAMELQAFVDSGRPTNGKDNRGWRALHHACYLNELECVKILLRAKDVEVDAMAFEGETALTLACRKKSDTNKQIQTEIVRCLLKAKANPNLPNNNPWKLTLNEAIESHNIDILKHLIKSKVQINATDGSYGTPLFAAIQQGFLEAVILLLNKKAITDKQGPYNLTPLHCLLVYGKHDLSLLKMLISHQKILRNLNERDVRGATPLTLACMCNWSDAVIVLLEKNADPNIKTYDGNLPLFYAAEEFDDDDVLDSESAFSKLARATSIEGFITHQQRCGGKEFWSLFHMLLRKNKLQMLKYFLKMDLRPDSFILPVEVIPYSAIPFWDQLCSFTVLSPLAYVCFLCDNEEKVHLAQLLINAGSSVNCASSCHLPPIVTLSSQSKCNSYQTSSECQLMKLLIENGADLFYKIREHDPLPAAYLMSYHSNKLAILWFLLHNCIPADVIFTPESFIGLKNFYEKFLNAYSEDFILRRLCIVNRFVPQLPSKVWELFNIPKHDFPHHLRQSTDNPKMLLHLSALSVRQTLWRFKKMHLFQSIEKLCIELALPNRIKDILLLNHDKFQD